MYHKQNKFIQKHCLIFVRILFNALICLQLDGCELLIFVLVNDSVQILYYSIILLMHYAVKISYQV